MRSGAKISIVWEYFKKSEDTKFVRCTICDKFFKFFGSTTNLKRHLHNVHSVELTQNETMEEHNYEYHEATEENEGQNILEENEDVKKKIDVNDIQIVEVLGYTDSPELTPTKQQSVSSDIINRKRKTYFMNHNLNRKFAKPSPYTSTPATIGVNTPTTPVISEYDAVGINVTAKLKRMDPVQAVHAESLINNILARGLLKTLTSDTYLGDKSLSSTSIC